MKKTAKGRRRRCCCCCNLITSTILFFFKPLLLSFFHSSFPPPPPPPPPFFLTSRWALQKPDEYSSSSSRVEAIDYSRQAQLSSLISISLFIFIPSLKEEEEDGAARGSAASVSLVVLLLLLLLFILWRTALYISRWFASFMPTSHPGPSRQPTAPALTDSVALRFINSLMT